jgi:diadenosine tetraphosphate (Ap4A) HIT family hydrolase
MSILLTTSMKHPFHASTNDSSEKQCQFCTKHSTTTLRRIAQNGLAQAFLTNAPVVPGHTLIIPDRCVGGIDDLSAKEFSAIFTLLAVLKPALRDTFGAEGFNYAWNEGTVAGQTVPHLHLHVLPRRLGDTGVLGYDPRQFFYRTAPRDTSPIHDLAIIAESVKRRVSHFAVKQPKN